MKYFEKLRSKEGNISLCPIDLSDSMQYYEWKNCDDEENRIVFNTYKYGKLENPESALKELNDLAIDDAFAIVNDSKLIGFIGYSDTKMFNQRTNVWIQINPAIDMDKQIAFGVEALDTFINYSYDSMNFNNIIMQFPTFNKQALEILKNSNMQYLGTTSFTELYQDNLYYNEVYYQTTKTSYAKKQLHNEKIDKEYKRIVIPSESKLSELVQGERISLMKCSTPTDGQVSQFLKNLNNPRIAIPFGWYKTNWNDYRSRKYLANSDYVVMQGESLVGCVNLFRKDERSHNAQLEIMIGEDYQGKGYGREAFLLLLKDAFVNGGYVNLLSSVFSFNNKSQNLHESLGYHKIGSRKKAYYAYETFHDIEMYEMTKDTYCKKYFK